MTSKNSFFNLMKEDLKRRLWTIALSLLAFFFLFPVASALMMSSIHHKYKYMSPEKAIYAGERIFKVFTELHGMENFFLSAVSVLLALIIAISGFSHLHSAKKTDFYHSLPLSRKKLFTLITLDGMLIIILPYFIFSIISAIMVSMDTGYQNCIQVALNSFLIRLPMVLFCYIVAIIAVIMTGHIVVSILGVGVFYTLLPIMILIHRGLKETFYTTFYAPEKELSFSLLHSSPLFLIFDKNQEWVLHNAMYALIATAVFTVLAFFLYLIRPSEAAGRAMAFKKSRAPIKFLIVISVSLCTGLFGYILDNSDGWSIFGLICGLLISYCTIEIIYHFDFKKLFSHKIQLLLCFLISFGIFFVFRLDLTGYDRYLPSPSKLESAGIFSEYMEPEWRELDMEEIIDGDYVNRFYNKNISDIINPMHFSDTELIYKIEEIANRRNLNTAEVYEDSEYVHYETIYVAYHLKNGKTVFRQYGVNLADIKTELEQLYDSEEWKAAVYPVLDFDIENIHSIIYEYGAGYVPLSIKDKTKLQKLLSVYKEEFSSLSSETRKKESPIGCIRFQDKEQDQNMRLMQKRYEKDENSFQYSYFKHYYPLYPSFVKTIAQLEALGIDPYSELDEDNIESLTIEYTNTKYNEKYDYYDYYDDIPISAPYMDMTVLDKDKIRQVLAKAWKRQLNYNNNFRIPFSHINIIVELKNLPENIEESANLRFEMSLEVSDIPDFIKEEFSIDEDVIENFENLGYPYYYY